MQGSLSEERPIIKDEFQCEDVSQEVARQDDGHKPERVEHLW